MYIGKNIFFLQLQHDIQPEASGERRRVLHRRPRLCILPITLVLYAFIFAFAEYLIGRIFRYMYIETFGTFTE